VKQINQLLQSFKKTKLQNKNKQTNIKIMSAAIIELLGNSFTNKSKETLTGSVLAGKTIGST